MSKLYIITLNILPFLINANGYLSHLKERIKEDIRNIKIKYGFTKKNLILGGIKNLSWKSSCLRILPVSSRTCPGIE